MTVSLFLSSFAAAVIGAMGLGGGGILIAYLTAFQNVEQLTAQGINLVFFLPTAIIAVILHSKNKLIDYRRAVFLALGGVLGVAAGTFTLSFISPKLISKIFATALLILGVTELLKKKTD